jgi:DNA-binding MarR family transcriptional regulator
MNKKEYHVQIMNIKEKEDALTLELLNTIEKKSDVTQRHLANQLDVALGLANSYLKRCVRKGLIKIQQAPANRYLYYLTPKGFLEKSRLSAAYLTTSFDFYRRASVSCENVFEECASKELHKVLLCGMSELAEIASLRAHEKDIDIVGTLDRYAQNKTFLALPLWNSFDLLSDFDACIITEIKESRNLIEYVSTQVSPEIIFVPDILGINIISKEPQPNSE